LKNAVALLASAILVAGALAAVVGTATVEWLYPQMAPAASARPAVTSSHPAPGAPASPLESLALEVLRRTGVGDIFGALALTAPGSVSEEALRQAARLSPRPLRAAILPGPEGRPAQLLVWADYQRDNAKTARGLYQVTITGDKATALSGPVAPEGGYLPLSLQPLDEKARKVDMNAYRSRGLLLFAARNPEPGLAETMARLQAAYAPKGIDVVLVLDVRSPDWLPAARAAGFQGTVWRIKGRLEDVPVPSQGPYLGAAGLLVSRDGLAVASLAALDPGRYGLLGQPPDSIAQLVFQTYGLLP
jgi:hypothetical protein